MIAPKAVVEKLGELKTQNILRLVEGASAMPADADGFKTTDAAYVVPGNETSGPNNAGTMIIRQEVTAQMHVFLVFTARDALGAKALDRCIPVRDAVKDLLIGWQPDGEVTPLIYVAGRIIYFQNSTLIYQLVFSNRYYVRK